MTPVLTVESKQEEAVRRKRDDAVRALQGTLQEWLREKQTTLLLEVFVVLGKALIDNVLTLEGRWRLHGCIQETHRRRRPGVHPVVVFTGWAGDPPARYGEGKLLAELFRSYELTHGFAWRGALIAEEEARSTVENIQKALALLCEAIDGLKQEFPRARIVILRFFIVSSDYHVGRMWEVDEHAPELSDLEPLRQEGREVLPVPIPYLFPACGDELREWLAEGYLQMHRLSLAVVNLLGLAGNVHREGGKHEAKRIEPGTIGELRRVPFETLGQTAFVLEGLMRRELGEQSRGQLLDNYSKAKELIPETIETLRGLAGDLEPLVEQPFAEGQIETWKHAYDRLQLVMPLRTRILDPDSAAIGL